MFSNNSGGSRKIPGTYYAEGSETPKISRQLVWRAAVEMSKNWSQLALQVYSLNRTALCCIFISFLFSSGSAGNFYILLVIFPLLTLLKMKICHWISGQIPRFLYQVE